MKILTLFNLKYVLFNMDHNFWVCNGKREIIEGDIKILTLFNIKNVLFNMDHKFWIWNG